MCMNSSYQSRLAELLKRKGIGPAGSKSLKQEELEELTYLFTHQEVSLTTKASMLTALLLLEPTAPEALFLDALMANPSDKLPTELLPYLQKHSSHPYLHLILKNIQKQDLSSEECDLAMQYFFGDTPAYLQASFLEAQRLKRETFIENSHFFDAFWHRTKRETTQLPVVVDIANSYDGHVRTKNYALLTSLLLAKLKIPTLIHGLEKVAPKNGLTLHQLLKALGKTPRMTLTEAKEQLETEAWAYVDQATFFPTLHDKVKMREEMVKRPFIATFEKLLQPIRATEGNHLVTAYTHKHYKQEVPKLLQHQGKCRKAIVWKGEEGSTQLPLHKASEYVLVNGEQIKEGIISPQDFGIELLENTDKTEVSTANVIQNMRQAIAGENDFVKWQVIYNVLSIISLFDLADTDKHTLETLFHQIIL